LPTLPSIPSIIRLSTTEINFSARVDTKEIIFSDLTRHFIKTRSRFFQAWASISVASRVRDENKYTWTKKETNYSWSSEQSWWKEEQSWWKEEWVTQPKDERLLAIWQ
tara:strand:- start:3841 stop:4164 length:324 start_codon:yes stop_codon:yes gene_type:complete